MVVRLSPPSRESGKKRKHDILIAISYMGAFTTTRSCHRSLGGQDCTSGWMRRTIIRTVGETQLCIVHFHIIWTSGVSTLASTRSPSLKTFPNKSGAIYLTRCRSLILGLKPAAVNASIVQTKSIWLGFVGRKLYGNRSLARIALRTLGKEPTEEQIMAKCESIKPLGVREALAKELKAEICRAFNNGEEV